MGKPHSEMGFFGNVIHYDENGRKTGESWPGLLDDMVHYDANGNKTGTSSPGLFGGVNHYDEHYNRTGTSYTGFTGETQHYDAKGQRVGTSYTGLTGSDLHSSDDVAGMDSYDYSRTMEGSDTQPYRSTLDMEYTPLCKETFLFGLKLFGIPVAVSLLIVLLLRLLD